MEPKSTAPGLGPQCRTTIRRVTIVGTGMIGTSVALALRRAGIHVGLADRDADAVAGAIQMGAGVALRPEDPPADVVVIATPPSAVPGVLRDAQDRRLGGVYTDVASTKTGILAAAEQAGCDLRTYIPGHPLAGHELSGPWAAQANLFTGRPWVVCSHPAARLQPLLLVTELVAECGAELRLLTASAHDQVVAEVSTPPHVISAA